VLIEYQWAEGHNDRLPVLPAGGSMTRGGVIINVGDGPGELKIQTDLFLYVWGIVIYDDGHGEVRRCRTRLGSLFAAKKFTPRFFHRLANSCRP
jgi:hypothetical protein